MERFEDRIAVVTGAASGIGRSLALAFGRAGCRVVAADVEVAALDRVGHELRDAGIDCLTVPTDVADAAAVDRLAAATLDRFGAAHILCNNAGVSVTGAFVDQTIEDWEWVLGVDLWGTVHGMRSFLPLLSAQDEAHIVNTASVIGLLPFPMRASYNAAKFAVVGLTESTQLELAEQAPHVGMTLLCPGATRTNLVSSARNRPPARRGGPAPTPVAVPADDEVARSAAIVEAGMDPDAVARLVLDAVRTRRFYVLTEPSPYAAGLHERTRRILSGEPPQTMPVEQMLRP